MSAIHITGSICLSDGQISPVDETIFEFGAGTLAEAYPLTQHADACAIINYRTDEGAFLYVARSDVILNGTALANTQEGIELHQWQRVTVQSQIPEDGQFLSVTAEIMSSMRESEI